MAEYLIQDTTLTGIADAIRGKTGGTAPVAVSDMAAQIEGIQAGGGDIDALIDKSITEISSNVDKIGHYAFNNCAQLTTADFPVATSIGIYAFEYCTQLTTVNAPAITSIGKSAFNNCAQLTAADFPVATSIGTYAFEYCNQLTTANFPALMSISRSAFKSCAQLTTADFPVLMSIGDSAFNSCRQLTTADFPVATSIGANAFEYCSSLKSFVLRSDAMATLSSTSVFTSTPIASGKGYIYVPSALIEQYKVATNWSTYAAQFRALEDYTVDGTVTGELDPAKTGT